MINLEHDLYTPQDKYHGEGLFMTLQKQGFFLNMFEIAYLINFYYETSEIRSIDFIYLYQLDVFISCPCPKSIFMETCVYIIHNTGIRPFSPQIIIALTYFLALKKILYKWHHFLYFSFGITNCVQSSRLKLNISFTRCIQFLTTL